LDCWLSERIRQFAPVPPDLTLVRIKTIPGNAGRPPVATTRFIGRELELEQLASMLSRPDVRLVTLTGPGGVGKTRLAMELLDRRMRETFDEIAFVSLGAIRNPEMVAGEIERALGIGDGGNLPIEFKISRAFQRDRVLLVIDSFEHLLDGAKLVSQMIVACPGLTVLVTSRAMLHLTGEWIVPLAPFSVPSEATPISNKEFKMSDPVLLFCDRAVAVKPRFALTPANAEAIRTICSRLEGMPLAIELAAARIAILTPQELVKRLDSRLPALSGGPRDAPERHRTMRDAINWSYDLLSPAEKSLFCRLSLFTGGFTIEAVEMIGAGLATNADPGGVLDILSALVSNSLVGQYEVRGESRFRMLETIREFGAEQLALRGEADQLQLLLAGYWLELCEQAESDLLGGPGQLGRLLQLAAEQDNLRSALTWSFGNQPEIGLRLAAALGWFWYLRGHFTEGRDWLKRALMQTDSITKGPYLKALRGAGILEHRLGNDDEAIRLLQQCREWASRRGDVQAELLATGVLGVVFEDRGELDLAEELLTGALVTLNVSTGMIVIPLKGLALAHLGVIAWGKGDLVGASKHLDSALAFNLEHGNEWGAANAQSLLSLLNILNGDIAGAVDLLTQSLATFWRFESAEEIGFALSNAGVIRAAMGDHPSAVHYFGAAAGLLDRTGSKARAPESVVYDQVIEDCRAALGSDAFNTGWTAGISTFLIDVVNSAISMQAPAGSRDSVTDLLSEREREVLYLLMEGKSDRDIAAALFISPRTAQGHVARVLAKLEVSNRREAVTVARRLLPCNKQG